MMTLIFIILPTTAQPERLRQRHRSNLWTNRTYLIRFRTVGLALPDVEATTKYDGSPVVLVRLSRIDRDALGDLVPVSRQLAWEKIRKAAQKKRT
jgi:hypothetical protein